MELDRDICYRAIAARDRRFDGRFFIAVRTTGIYCRPICPARTPMRKNVEFYATAAAAQEAGYRPCLRCRPETAPNIGAWNGTSNTVSRALGLIEAGLLDDGGVEVLADRLGIGPRQLRRLFQEHIGASPYAVAQTRRVLLAKQLIHDTNLPMTAVAMASGFGSLRRFNDTFHLLYGRPPSQLRRAREGAAREASPIALTLSYKPPYDWRAIADFLAARAIAGVERVEPLGYRRTIALDGAVGTIEVTPEPDRNRLRVAIAFPKLSSLPGIIARVRRIFDLGADPEAIGAHLARDPLLAPLIARRPGLRLPGAWDGFEMAVRAVIGQQITIAAARNLLGRLVARFGEALPSPGEGLSHVFPSPARLIGAEIASLGMPAARGRAIEAVARAAVARPESFERAASLEQAIETLCAVPGIGRWTAHYIAIRALREPDAFPDSDIGLLRALAENGVRPTPKDVLARAEAWRPWRAYAAQHLWTNDAQISRQTKALKRRDAKALRAEENLHEAMV
jgi:AraC family transcriptional regulator, regulatory protein of adaptative response / DNA-3-methyladenine glycosylase II